MESLLLLDLQRTWPPPCTDITIPFLLIPSSFPQRLWGFSQHVFFSLMLASVFLRNVSWWLFVGLLAFDTIYWMPMCELVIISLLHTPSFVSSLILSTISINLIVIMHIFSIYQILYNHYISFFLGMNKWPNFSFISLYMQLQFSPTSVRSYQIFFPGC